LPSFRVSRAHRRVFNNCSDMFIVAVMSHRNELLQTEVATVAPFVHTCGAQNEPFRKRAPDATAASQWGIRRRVNWSSSRSRVWSFRQKLAGEKRVEKHSTTPIKGIQATQTVALRDRRTVKPFDNAILMGLYLDVGWCWQYEDYRMCRTRSHSIVRRSWHNL
jgi:hypothetical protein